MRRSIAEGSGVRLEAAGRRVMIFGYYGFRNMGDEAILRSLLEALDDQGGFEPTIVSRDPELTSRTHGVRAIPDRDIELLVEEAQEKDLFLLGGGGLFQDYWGVDCATTLTPDHWGLTFFALPAVFSRVFTKPFAAVGLGVGPLHSFSGKKMTAAILNQASWIHLRDSTSAEALETLGVDCSKVVVGQDLALALHPPTPDEIRVLCQEQEHLPRPWIAVSVRPWEIHGSTGWIRDLAKGIDGVLERTGGSVLLLPFQTTAEAEEQDDRDIAEQVKSLLSSTRRVQIAGMAGDYRSAMAWIANSDALLGMRLHSLAFATLVGTPAAGIAYDPKITRFCQAIGGEAPFARIERIQPEWVFETVELLLNSDRRFRLKTAPLVKEAVRSRREVAKALAHLCQVLPSPSRATDGMDALIFDSLLNLAGRSSRLAAHLFRQGGATSDAESRWNASELRRLRLKLREAEREQLLWFDRYQEALTKKRAQDGLLHEIVKSRGWQLLNAYWTLARGVRQLFTRPARFLGRALARVTRRLARKGSGGARPSRNWYEYSFDRYRIARSRLVSSTLKEITAAGEPGLVSIVLPVYNGGEHLAEAIESILSQTWDRFELIAINDGSTDDTPSVLEEYARRDSRLRVVHQENRKLPRTLSRGFRMAQGEFFTWTSADNRMKPTCLSLLVENLRKHPETDLVYANVDIIGEDGEPLRNSPWYSDYQIPRGSEHIHLPKDASELNIWPNNYIGAAFLYRARLGKLLGDYSPFRFTTEDYDYWMRANILGCIKHVDFDDTVYEYRFHSRSLTARDVELEITEGRESLMVFDDFRRDFALTPLLWYLNGNRKLVAALSRMLTDRGDLIAGDSTSDPEMLPSLWTPLIWLEFGDLEREPPRPAAARDCLKVLVWPPGDNPPPDELDPFWDLCIVLGSERPLRLLNGHRGWFAVADLQGLIDAVDTVARSREFEKIEAEIHEPAPPSLQVTAVVCTHRRTERLRNALASLARQTLPRERFEIVIVDNSPEDGDVAGAVKDFCIGVPKLDPRFIRLVPCPFKGLSHARNAGISEARGEIIAFLDDDAIAEPDLLEVIRDTFATHPKTGVVGGQIRLRCPSPRPKMVQPGWERYWSQFIPVGDGYREAEYWWDYPWGANWSARRKSLLAIGGFRSRYGRKGNDFSGGEEIIAAALIERLGWRIAVEPRAQVVHDVEPSRYSWDHVRRTILASTVVNYQAQKDLYLPMESTLINTVKLLLNPTLDSTVQATPAARARHWIFRKLAYLKLLQLQVVDLWNRARG